MATYRYYLAYGSNLSLSQMAQRCPDAIPVGRAVLHNYQLLFKGSKSGNYLTVEPCDGYKVPILVWRISARDERNLDRYEGCPTFYYKKSLSVEMKPLDDGRRISTICGIIYIMHEDRKCGLPTNTYLRVCEEGYKRFGFDTNCLYNAVVASSR